MIPSAPVHRITTPGAAIELACPLCGTVNRIHCSGATQRPYAEHYTSRCSWCEALLLVTAISRMPKERHP